MGATDDIANSLTTLTVDTLRFSESARADVIAHLKVLEERLAADIRRANISGTTRPSVRLRRQQALIQQSRATIKTHFRKARTQLDSELVDLANLEAGASLKRVNEIVGFDVFTVATPPAVLRKIVTSDAVVGAAAKDWWKKQTDDTVLRFSSQVRLGVLAGETNDEIVTRVVGRETGRARRLNVAGRTRTFRDRVGGAMDITRNQATTLVRTSTLAISNSVREELYESNKDVLKGRQALVTLDNLTSDICIARSGGAWDMQGKPLPESRVRIPYPGPTPWHFNCRTIIIPITKTWEELAGKELPGVKELSQGTRASLDGQIAADVTYEQWLRGKSVKTQKEVLGLGKWQLWQDKKINLTQLIDQSGNPLTLRQLKAKHE